MYTPAGSASHSAEPMPRKEIAIMVGFDVEKTIQVAAYLIKHRGGRENYMRLGKLIYLADRRSLEERRIPICGDTPIAMERGPVPSRTLDLIKGADPQSVRWDQFIRRDSYDVVLENDPGNLALSRADVRVLEEVAEEHRNKDEWELVSWCHGNLPEYEKNREGRGTGKAKRIPLDDILEEIGLAGSAREIVDQINENAKFAAFFDDHMPSVQ